MNQTCGEINKNIRNSERGEGGYKLILFLIGLFLVGWAGFNYIPVDYNARAYKQEMEATVQQAVVLPAAMNNPVGWTDAQIKKIATDYGVPEDAVYEITQGKSGGVSATVKFKKSISLLPFYTYEYQFDYTAKTSNFMLK